MSIGRAWWMNFSKLDVELGEPAHQQLRRCGLLAVRRETALDFHGCMPSPPSLR